MLCLVSWVECWVAIINCVGTVKKHVLVCLDVSACANSDGFWLSRPSEYISPRRDWQKLAQAAWANGHQGDERQFWARWSRLSERARQCHCSWLEPSPRRRVLVWARETSHLSEALLPEWRAERGVCMLMDFFALRCWMLVWIVYAFPSMNWVALHE